jgi:uncharacterized SAM-binding protein YcdF (DUF218 family)
VPAGYPLVAPREKSWVFFWLSKILWFLASPANLLLVALVVGALLLWTRRRRFGRWLVGLVAVAALLVATLPLGEALLSRLEDRFPVVVEPTGPVDGIVVLGGVVNQVITRSRGQMAIGGAVERLTELANLARMHPQAKIVFTGGSGDLFAQEVKEADALAPLLRTLGLDPDRIILENQSRNTYENAVYSREVATPKPGERWVLITSAFHMPRAVGCFRRAGWEGLLPYPVDFHFPPGGGLGLRFDLGRGLGWLEDGLHEWIGLLFYWLTDRTDAFFPAPLQVSEGHHRG